MRQMFGDGNYVPFEELSDKISGIIHIDVEVSAMLHYLFTNYLLVRV